MLYLAYDGDNAGRMVGRSILANDESSLHEVSNRIRLGHEIVQRWVEDHGGKFISGGGDEGIFSLPENAIENVEELRKDYLFATNLTMTVGIGKNLSEAGKALLAGKLRGKNMMVAYDDSVESELSNAHERVKTGQGSDEDKKLDEAYIDNEKAPGAEQDSVAAQENGGVGENAKTGSQSEDGDVNSIPEPTSRRMTDKEKDMPAVQAGASEAEPKDAYNEKDPEENDMADKKPDPKAKESDKADPKAKAAAAPAEDGKDLMNIDSEDLAGCKDDACSRPSNFDETQNPGDMGQGDEPPQEGDATALEEAGLEGDPAAEEGDPAAEEGDPAAAAEGEEAPQMNAEGDPNAAEEEEGSPDLSAVLEDGLNSEAEGAGKDQVVQMVSAALAGFKAQKHIMERAKEQAPELYNSCISMLKAMIEMAKLLGLNDAGSMGGEQGDNLFAPAGEEQAGVDGQAAPGEEGALPPAEEEEEGGEEGKDGKAPPFGGKEGKEGDDKKSPPKKGEEKGKEPPKKAAPKEGAAKAPKEKSQ